MIGLDTNALVRYLTQDDAKQADAAARVIEQPSGAFLIQPVVLCELVWVLNTAYKFSRQEIGGTLDQVLRTAVFHVPDKDNVWHALADYHSGKGDFADYYIGRANQSEGAESTFTFDKALDRASLLQVSSP